MLPMQNVCMPVFLVTLLIVVSSYEAYILTQMSDTSNEVMCLCVVFK